jgi:hypothetical protein
MEKRRLLPVPVDRLSLLFDREDRREMVRLIHRPRLGLAASASAKSLLAAALDALPLMLLEESSLFVPSDEHEKDAIVDTV